MQLLEEAVSKLRNLKMAHQEGHVYTYEGKINGEKVTILLDSGASANFIAASAVQRLKISAKQKVAPDVVTLAGGQTLQSTHLISTRFSIGTLQDMDRFHQMDLKEFDIVLGSPWLRRQDPQYSHRTGVAVVKQRGVEHVLVPDQDKEAKLLQSKLLISALQMAKALKKGEEAYLVDLHPVDPTTAPEAIPTGTPAFQAALKTLLKQFEDVVPSDPNFQVPFPPERDVDHSIVTLPDAVPPNKAAYRLSPAEKEELLKQLKDLTDRGLIRPSSSPYGSPIIFVKKKDGTKRMCVDYRALNNITIKNRYPLPRIDELLDKLHGATVFSKLDLWSGYWQVRMKEEDIQKTAFNTGDGLYEFKVLPFGLCNAPATFMRMMNNVLFDLVKKGFVLVYLDDICIYSKSEEEHLDHLEQVLKLLGQNKLFCKLSKCAFGLPSVEFLGHIVSGIGIAMDTQKIKAVVDWPVPKNATEVLQFKGLVGFYRRFIKDFSKIAAPLSALTGDVPFKMGEEELASFNALKTAITTAPVLSPPDPDPAKPFLICCDSSGKALGAVLSQGTGADMRVIAFESRKLNDAETRYENHDKELLAIVHALKKWRHYVQGARFTIETDNSAAKFIQTKPVLTSMQAKWLRTLQEYDCDIKHRPGPENIVADALSRRPDYFTINVMASLVVSVPDLLPQIQAAAATDLEYKGVKEAVEGGNPKGDFQLKDGLLWKGTRGERLYIPDCDLRKKLALEAHEGPLCGHLGRDKTQERLARHYYWPKMNVMVAEMCRSCEPCQAIKPSHQAKLGLLQPNPIPTSLFQIITIDLITQLPPTKKGYTAICGVTDALSGLVKAFPTKDTVTSEELAQQFFEAWVQHHGLPEKVISDRDTKFTAEFWQCFHKHLGTSLNMSTTNHPETDGRSERTNQTLEDILRVYVNPYHNDWDEHLPMATFAINDAVHASKGVSPFEACYGQNVRNPLALVMPPEGPKVPESTKEFFARRRQELRRLQIAMRVAQERQVEQANRHRSDVEFKKGEKVWLSSSHIHVPRAQNAGRKFQPRYHGPYEITEVVSKVAYRLELPKHYKAHPVVHVSRLKAFVDGKAWYPGRPNHPVPLPPELIDGELFYQIESFTNHRMSGNPRSKTRLAVPQFLVKWAGWEQSESKWLSAEHLRGEMTDECYTELVEAYEDRTGVKLDARWKAPVIPTEPARRLTCISVAACLRVA